ncbi:hypothetical protein GCM10010411_75330 [Actinomadura fulvescens]|uniref:Uncharacterized protein n=1 Tax=Actinomadura fulvescens TaxID=46160 RepID=A0ABN3QIM2_9ACTN
MTSPDSHAQYQAKVDELRQSLPALADLLGPGPWAPASLASLPAASVVTGAFHTVIGFADPRLVLYTGTSSQPGEPRTGWCLLGATTNARAEGLAIPPAAAAEATHPDTVRAMQLLATDIPEHDEAAVEALTAPAAVAELASMAESAHRHYLQAIPPQQAEIGVEIYAVTTAMDDFAGATIDLLCVGSPIWVARLRPPARD